MRLALAVIAASGCGRIGFDALQPPAIVEVESMGANAVSSATVTFTVIAPGSAILLATSTDTGVDAITSVTGGGVTWQPVATVRGLGEGCTMCLRGALWYGADSTGDDPTVTVAFGGQDDLVITAVELSHVSGISDRAVNGPAATAAITSGTVATEPGDIVIAAAAWDRAMPTSGPSGDFTSLAVTPAPGGAWLALAAAEARTTGPSATSWTLAAATAAWAAMIVALH